jgi:hypothetical protein
VSEPQAVGTATLPPEDDPYDAFLAAVRARFAAACDALGARPALFATQVPDLFEVFLAALPAAWRPSQTCATCRAFVTRYGGLVSVDADGDTRPVLWAPDAVPAPYAPAVRALAAAVAAAPIERVFLSSEAGWGSPVKGPWSHLAVTPPSAVVFPATGVKTASQVVAERQEDRQTLLRALEEFPPEPIKRAAALLRTDALYRSEKCLGVAEWLLGVHDRRRSARSERRRDNLTWLAVATAPPGFCHVRSTMIGTLLEDLVGELPFETIKARFAAKMHPLQYQRPTAAPSAQNLARAEAIVAQLATAGALERRFAKLADIEAVWRPAPPAPKPKPGGVFSHLAPRAERGAIAVDAPPTVMTWDKFSRTVMPDATRIEYFVPASNQSYLALVTAKHPEAPPILQWDAPERRNPVSLYVYVKGSPPAQWNLRPDAYHLVTAITLAPAMWHATSARSHHTQLALFVLEGARDLQYKSGAGFFPEFLRNEYHEIRATMEAYAKRAVIEGKDEAEACGISLQKGAAWNHRFRVTSKDGVTLSYTLDRWD